MPIIKKNEPLGKRPIVIVYYGEPGICKTSLFNTSDTPLLIDFDRGVERSIHRPDTLKVNTWEDVLSEEKEGTFKNYKTIGIDTAKAALDDFLMSYVVSLDYKLQKNKLQAYGAIGDGFKLFVSNRRTENADIVILAHGKKDEDTKKIIPDVTGQSYGLLLRIADQVGYISMQNGKRTVQFEPSDTTVGKNVACLPMIEIPDKGSPDFRNFNAMIVTRVKDALDAMSEAQREALLKSEKYQKEIEDCNDPEEMTVLLASIGILPDHLKLPLRAVIGKRTKEKGWLVNKDTKKFEAPPSVETKPIENTSDPVQAEKKKDDPIPETSYDDKVKIITSLGMNYEIDQFVLDDIIVTCDQLADLNQEYFNELVVMLNDAKKPVKKPAKAKKEEPAHV